jgi:hypothetical protein
LNRILLNVLRLIILESSGSSRGHASFQNQGWRGVFLVKACPLVPRPYISPSSRMLAKRCISSNWIRVLDSKRCLLELVIDVRHSMASQTQRSIWQEQRRLLHRCCPPYGYEPSFRFQAIPNFAPRPCCMFIIEYLFATERVTADGLPE